MGIGWGVGYQIFLSRSSLAHRYTLLLFWGIFLSSWLGAKVLFLLTAPEISSEKLMSNMNFWMGGGFVFYGGFLGAIIFLLFYHLSRHPWNKETIWGMVPALTMGHAIGRLGCFLAGCCFGKVTDWWWGIHLHGADRHPTQLLESLGLFCISWFVWRRPANGSSLRLYLVSYGLLRYGTELLRGDSIRGSWGPLTPSEWISLALLLLGLVTSFSLRFRSVKI
jgi:phosphatidylglycerol---prolipoprotein diacylglyceryl transferase